MEQFTRVAALDARTFRHIRSKARHLTRTTTIPGMDADDIAQHLFLDLWRRRHAFDPTRASFPTFLDRIVANRIATLTVPTARLRAERNQVWLDRLIEDDDTSTLAETISDPLAPSELDHALALDVRRFVADLTPALRRCCAILLEPNLGQTAAQAGLHRSTVYENARRLRRMAEAAGLKDYLRGPRHNSNRAGMCLP